MQLEGWRIRCDVGKATDGLENELCSFSNLSVTSPTSQLILQPFRRFTYVTAHYPTLPFLHLRHSSFSNPSFASPTSQALHHLASRPWHYISTILTSKRQRFTGSLNRLLGKFKLESCKDEFCKYWVYEELLLSEAPCFTVFKSVNTHEARRESIYSAQGTISAFVSTDPRRDFHATDVILKPDLSLIAGSTTHCANPLAVTHVFSCVRRTNAMQCFVQWLHIQCVKEHTFKKEYYGIGNSN